MFFHCEFFYFIVNFFTVVFPCSSVSLAKCFIYHFIYRFVYEGKIYYRFIVGCSLVREKRSVINLWLYSRSDDSLKTWWWFQMALRMEAVTSLHAKLRPTQDLITRRCWVGSPVGLNFVCILPEWLFMYKNPYLARKRHT